MTVVAGAPGAVHPLRAGELTVGRAEEADLCLPLPEVSRRHSRFRYHPPDICSVEDLGSQGGTLVNGERLPGAAPALLRPGDRVQIGPVVLLYTLGAADEATVAAARIATVAKLFVGGVEADRIPLGDESLPLGRAEDAAVVLADPSVSRLHAVVEPVPGGYEVVDQRSRLGSRINGRHFERHRLIIGDQLQLGPFFFRFDGRTLVRTVGWTGVEVAARGLRRRVGSTTILDDVSLQVQRGQFAMILGPSGAGKSSLLDALAGLRPAEAGEVRYDGADFYRHYARLRTLLGYVPQEDIVHRELTVVQALWFSAQLRLPAGTPAREIRKLVAHTVTRLGLEERRHTPVHRLSGGERKRVSVGVELLDRPAALFLDEPTSGLDPAAEFKLTELLRHLADDGCTVVCTTHVLENAYLADRLFVLHAGRLVFQGSTPEARAYFGVERLTNLYQSLGEHSAQEWHQAQQRSGGDEPAADVPATSMPDGLPLPRPERHRSAVPTLLRRQWVILASDPKNFLFLLGQPLAIALLVAWATDDGALGLFFAYLSTLWFGCSNAAPEIVRERAIYRREHLAGLSRQAYLLGKFLLLGTLTAAQGWFLYACLWAARYFLYPAPEFGLARGIDGSVGWSLGALLGTAFAAVGIGLAVSAWARTVLQAVMAVPLVLIPQILFCGSVVETNQMTSPGVFALTNALPSHAAQTMMDVGAFAGRTITGGVYNAHKKAGDHLKDLLLREALARSTGPTAINKGDLRAQVALGFRTGQLYRETSLGWFAALKLVGWTLLGYVAAVWGLRTRERG